MKKKSGFTLVELVVAMAIIGILIALGIAGFSIARRGARNTARKKAADELLLALEDFEGTYRTTPTSIDVDVENNQITLTAGTTSKDYDITPISGIEKGSDVSDCSGCPSEVEDNELQLIFDSDGRIGVCLEPDGNYVIKGECGAEGGRDG